jgi:hypothetical protein
MDTSGRCTQRNHTDCSGKRRGGACACDCHARTTAVAVADTHDARTLLGDRGTTRHYHYAWDGKRNAYNVTRVQRNVRLSTLVRERWDGERRERDLVPVPWRVSVSVSPVRVRVDTTIAQEYAERIVLQELSALTR